uniref:Uncharacterized protein n=1 Tax=Arundo donax TaxID=35708 RepID=A0A0A8ZZS2_ARUDO
MDLPARCACVKLMRACPRQGSLLRRGG